MNKYSRLGTHVDATAKEIKDVFKKLSVKYHPDKNRSIKDKNERDRRDNLYTEIKDAYDTLIDDKEREKYDRSLGINRDIKVRVDPEIETTEDVYNKQTNTNKPDVVIDPNGEVYVDMFKAGKKKGVSSDFLSWFFGSKK